MKAKITATIANSFDIFIYELNKNTKAVAKGIFKHDNVDLKPMVGDDVDVLMVDDQYVIVKINERYNQLIRPRVANIDMMLVVVSTTQPELNTLALNKYLAFYEARNIKNVAIGFSKYDLLDASKKKFVDVIISDLKKDGYNVFVLTNEDDIFRLKQEIKDHTLCLAGNSGVGKSTLINKLDPTINQKTQEISLFLNRGKHTTTKTKLIRFANGFLVDTPGFGSLEVNLTKQEFATAFNDFANYARNCKFSNCLHLNENQCAVKDAVLNNKISKWRYDDYLKIISDLQNSNEVIVIKKK